MAWSLYIARYLNETVNASPPAPQGGTAEIGFAETGDAQPGAVPLSSTTSLTPGTGTLTVTGQDAYTQPFSVPSGSATITGQQAIVAISLTPGTGSITVTGQQANSSSLSTIVSAEYTGDGNNPRTFESTGTVPLVVMVVGKDGSGNEVGAIKTGTMPSGLSQPFRTAQTAAATTRANRILDLTSDGFTVGSDLNVAGRKYAYVIFPAGNPTTVVATSFVGPGGRVGGDGINTTSSTIFATGGFPIVTADECAATWARPAGNTVYSSGIALITSGRRLIRNSDGAVIAEANPGGFIDTTSFQGTVYISGTFASGTWHWEEYYVDLQGCAADLAIVMADDNAGGAEGSQPDMPSTILDSADAPTTNADWSGVGFGEIDANFVGAGDKALHLVVRTSGGVPYLKKGVTYHVVAFHDDEANTHVPLHVFKWTGTGALGTPPTLAGLDFKPDWAIVSGNNSNSWSKNSSNILGTNLHDRGFYDGNGDSFNAALASWDSGGVTLTAGGDWNGNGVKYVGIFFKSDPVVTGIQPSTGSLAVTGQTPTVSATAFQTITPGTGSVVAIGQIPRVAKTTVRTPSTGTLRVTGKAPKTKISNVHHIPIDTADDPPSGGIQIFGQQPIQILGIVPSTGSITATGYPPFVEPPDTPEYPDAGAITIEGQQPVQIIGIVPGTGAVVATGEAALPDLTVPAVKTVGTGVVGIEGQQPILILSIIPSTGEVIADTRDTEPTLGSLVTYITPGTGDVDTLSDPPTVLVSEAITITPGTGSVTIDGQQAFTGGAVIEITPGTGTLNVIGQPVTVSAPQPTPPTPPGPPPALGGGISPGKKAPPMWPTPATWIRCEIVAPPARLRGHATAEENELELLLDL